MNSERRTLTYSEAINEALCQAMHKDDSVICCGLGVDDPKGIFGTTLGLQERFGEDRVFDIPTSENAMTGIAIGAALNGQRPVMSHQRLDFFLLALDQLINNAAKWRYMFGGQDCVPITIRLILGRGWGQGPTHSQSLQAWFAHVPGLKVVMPSTARDAKGLLLESIFDDNPVLFLEHRWLHNQEGSVPTGDYREPLGKAQVLQDGKDLTIVSMSYMTIEALQAKDELKDQGYSCEIVDLRSINPIDWSTILKSVKRTGRLLVLDTGNETCSLAGEIIAKASMECFKYLKSPPRRLALPDVPTPTSHALADVYYKDIRHIIGAVNEIFQNPIEMSLLGHFKRLPSDVPGTWFKGPF